MDQKEEPVKISKKSIPGRNGGTLHPGDNGNGGRPKGVRNRSTVLKEFLEATLKTKNPITGEQENLTVEQRMALSMIAQVLTKGNVQAWNSIKDDVYGKLTDKIDHTSKGESISREQALTTEQLIAEAKKRGLPGVIFDKPET